MSDFVTAAPPSKPLDPYKRTNYTYGLVLGVDEFVQEQVYFLERDRIHNRGLHGYGTVCGLAVSVQDAGGGAGPEVVVSSGLAVNPQGQEIRVPLDQCAQLNAWLSRSEAEITARYGTAFSPLDVYVVLCYSECQTDSTPIPGEPCRSLADSVVPSRIADDFCLSFRLDPPNQTEEEETRALGRLFGRIEITDAQGPWLTQTQMEQAVRDLLTASPLGSPPPGSPPLGSPPPSSPPISSPPDDLLYLHPADAPYLLRAALRVWVTEVRPALLPVNKNCASGPPDEPCVLLARLQFAVNAAWQVNGAVTIDQEDRPILVNTRTLQEMLLHAEMGEDYLSVLSPPVSSPPASSPPVSSPPLSSPPVSSPPVSSPPTPAPYQVVAAGYFGPTGSTAKTGTPIQATFPTYNNLAATKASASGEYDLTFTGYQKPENSLYYIVKGTVFEGEAVRVPTRAGTLPKPVISRTNPANRITFQLVGFEAKSIRVRILDIANKPANVPFMVEISAYEAS